MQDDPQAGDRVRAYDWDHRPLEGIVEQSNSWMALVCDDQGQTHRFPVEDVFPAAERRPYRVSVVITRTYALVVEAGSPHEAHCLVQHLYTTEIHERGAVKDADVDFIGVHGEASP